MITCRQIEVICDEFTTSNHKPCMYTLSEWANLYNGSLAKYVRIWANLYNRLLTKYVRVWARSLLQYVQGREPFPCKRSLCASGSIFRYDVSGLNGSIAITPFNGCVAITPFEYYCLLSERGRGLRHQELLFETTWKCCCTATARPGLQDFQSPFYLEDLRLLAQQSHQYAEKTLAVHYSHLTTFKGTKYCLILLRIVSYSLFFKIGNVCSL